MEYIYSRVSTGKQETDNQVVKLKALYPNARVVEEVASGAKARPLLSNLLIAMQKGDTLIIAALDRLGRKTSEILLLIEDLEQRGIVLKSIREGVDYSTIAGRLVTQILVSISEMERRIIAERTKTALAAKRQKGIVGGRPKIFDSDLVQKVQQLKFAGYSCREIAKETGISPSRISQLTRTSNAETHKLG